MPQKIQPSVFVINLQRHFILNIEIKQRILASTTGTISIWYAYFASYPARLSSCCILHSLDLRGLLLCLTKVCSLWNKSVVSLHLALVLTASNESFPEDISTAIVIDLCDVPACCVLVLHCTVWHNITLEWHSLWHKGLLLPSVQHFRFATQKDICCFKSQHKIFCLTLF